MAGSRFAVGLCAIDIVARQDIVFDRAAPYEIAEAATVLHEDCVNGLHNEGGVAGKPGFDEGLAVRIVPYKGTVSCSEDPDKKPHLLDPFAMCWIECLLLTTPSNSAPAMLKVTRSAFHDGSFELDLIRLIPPSLCNWQGANQNLGLCVNTANSVRPPTSAD